MKLITASDEQYVFRLGRREKEMLAETLRRFPSLPAGHHRYSRGGATADDTDNQALLEEALASHRAEHRRRVQGLLSDPTRLAPEPPAYRLSLSREDLEWLLQVLNEVRVGSWLKAGSPDPEEEQPPRITPENAPHFALMEVAGYFESALLDAL